MNHNWLNKLKKLDETKAKLKMKVKHFVSMWNMVFLHYVALLLHFVMIGITYKKQKLPI